MSTKIVVPQLGESVMEATVARWLKQEGDPVGVGEVVVQLETEKVDLDVGAEQAGVLAHIERKECEDVRIGDVLGIIAEAAEAPGEAPAKEPGSGARETLKTPERAPEKATQKRPPEEAAEEPWEMPTAPHKPASVAPEPQSTLLARSLAQDRGVDLDAVPGTGPRNRVTKEDVERYLEKQQPAPEVAPAPTPQAAPAKTVDEREERIHMSRRRRTIAHRLVEVQHTAAMLTTFNEIDMSAVMEMRKRRKESFVERYGVNLGIVSFFIKAAIGALKAFPQLNAEIQGDDMILKHYYDIGIAIGADEGLVVPVLRDADRLSFAEIEKKIKEFVQKTQDNTLSLEVLRGGTFTITNGGVFGSLLSTPILNPPQVGILGLHKIEPRPVVVNDEIVVRPMMYVALSYDHRIVDGREAVQFLVRIKELVEDSEALLLEG